MNKPTLKHPAPDPKRAPGLTLVPYWTYDPNGHRIACARWVCPAPQALDREA